MNWSDPTARDDQARATLAQLVAFYQRYPCEAVSLHLLGASATVLGEFWQVSEPFARIGDTMCPVDGDGQPKTDEWRAYVHSCEAGQPVQIRTERWLDAHIEDLAAVEEAGWDRQFQAEADANADDATYQRLRDHMAASLGARHEDSLARRGDWAGETAFATGLIRAVRHLLNDGTGLLAMYFGRAARSVLAPKSRPSDQITDRQVVSTLVSSLIGAFSSAGLVRRGLRLRARGRIANADQWPLLESVLGDRALEVHPTLRRFYNNPSSWDARAAFSCPNVLVRIILSVVQRLTGQGLSESREGNTWPARFHVFSREDGTMHFVREIDCDDQLRVFDSDFAPGQTVDGTPAVVETFPELGVRVPLVPRLLHNGDLVLGANQVVWRGIALPAWVRVAFQGHVVGERSLTFSGTANLRIETWGGWAASWVGVPVRLGTLTYQAKRRTEQAGS
ncbi:MAG: hypothetical protein GWP91_06975 [Rhodobacterales bacterium]|nr:hypothetical protein [Rhodobacterales bacterium]